MRQDTDRAANGHRDESATGHRYTVHEAALLLGLSVDAVRKRAERGTLRREKGPDGTVYIVLDADRTATGQQPDDDQTDGRSRSDAGALISAKDETIATLREQLQAERQAHAEARRLLMAALEKIPPAIEASRERPGGPQSAAEESEGTEDTPSTRDAPQECSEPRSSWWCRWFGFE